MSKLDDLLLNEVKSEDKRREIKQTAIGELADKISLSVIDKEQILAIKINGCLSAEQMEILSKEFQKMGMKDRVILIGPDYDLVELCENCIGELV